MTTAGENATRLLQEMEETRRRELAEDQTPRRHAYVPEEKKPPNPMKFDSKKTPLRLLPVISLFRIAQVFGFGAKKYAENSWRSKEHEPVSWMRTFESIISHLFLWAAGEECDKQSGMNHLWHAGTQLMILIEHVETRSGKDDRFHNEPEHLEGLRGDE